MSDTPRTDSYAAYGTDYPQQKVVPANFAHQLERDLAAGLIENEEQARLLGMSAERECALRGKVERLERELDAARQDLAALREKEAK